MLDKPVGSVCTYISFNTKIISAIRNNDAIKNNKVRDLKEFLNKALRNNHSILVDSDGRIMSGEFNINAKDSSGNTLLHRICLSSPGYHATNRIILELILRYGADPTIPNAGDDSAIYCATREAIDAVIELDKDKFISFIETLVHQSFLGRKCLNAKDRSGYTPLHHCAWSEKKTAGDVAQVLIRLGAKIDAKNNDGSTPFQIAEARQTPAYAILKIINDERVNSLNDKRTKSGDV